MGITWGSSRIAEPSVCFHKLHSRFNEVYVRRWVVGVRIQNRFPREMASSPGLEVHILMIDEREILAKIAPL